MTEAQLGGTAHAVELNDESPNDNDLGLGYGSPEDDNENMEYGPPERISKVNSMCWIATMM